MTRGVRLYLVGSIVLVSLAGCSHGMFQADREPWRAEAEAACLKSGSVKESADLVRIDPISGPGVCGAEFPLKVAALGESNSSYGFVDEDLRPPAPIGGQPRWPVNQPPQQNYPPRQTYQQPIYQPPQNDAAAASGPMSLNPPNTAAAEDDINLPPEGTPGASYRPSQTYRPPSFQTQPPAPPRLGPERGDAVASVGAVAVKPTATLACPIVSALDHWLDSSVQPAAMRWFGNRVVEIKQISAYSCRGMNGQPNAHISEHAFGNALDVAAFVLADGRRISVEHGWNGLAEEQGFLRDVQGAACQQFTTVLAPGSNRYHYNHIHVDLMRRASRRFICEPAAISGEVVAARVQQRNGGREPDFTSSIPSRKDSKSKRKVDEDDEDD